MLEIKGKSGPKFILKKRKVMKIRNLGVLIEKVKEDLKLTEKTKNIRLKYKKSKKTVISIEELHREFKDSDRTVKLRLVFVESSKVRIEAKFQTQITGEQNVDMKSHIRKTKKDKGKGKFGMEESRDLGSKISKDSGFESLRESKPKLSKRKSKKNKSKKHKKTKNDEKKNSQESKIEGARPKIEIQKFSIEEIERILKENIDFKRKIDDKIRVIAQKQEELQKLLAENRNRETVKLENQTKVEPQKISKSGSSEYDSFDSLEKADVTKTKLTPPKINQKFDEDTKTKDIEKHKTPKTNLNAKKSNMRTRPRIPELSDSSISSDFRKSKHQKRNQNRAKKRKELKQPRTKNKNKAKVSSYESDCTVSSDYERFKSRKQMAQNKNRKNRNLKPTKAKDVKARGVKVAKPVKKVSSDDSYSSTSSNGNIPAPRKINKNPRSRGVRMTFKESCRISKKRF